MWLLIFLLNYALSWYSARTVSHSWLDARAAGRWAVVLCWAGAVLATLGFTWCYLTLALAAAHSFGLVVATSVNVVFQVGGVVLGSLAVGTTLLLVGCIRMRTLRDRYIRGAGDGLWNTYYGATLAGALKVPADPERESGDANDSGTMIVLFALLAATAILGVVQTYLMIRAGVTDGARQVAEEYRQIKSGFEFKRVVS
jgi:hypothetical protein